MLSCCRRHAALPLLTSIARGTGHATACIRTATQLTGLADNCCSFCLPSCAAASLLQILLCLPLYNRKAH